MALQIPDCSACELCAELEASVNGVIVERRQTATAIVPRRTRTPGSLIVVANRHVMSFNELQSAEIQDIALLTWTLSGIVMKTFDAAGLNVWWAFGVLAGQTTAHLIVEMVPRFPDVPYKYVDFSDVPEVTLSTRLQVARKLRDSLPLR